MPSLNPKTLKLPAEQLHPKQVDSQFVETQPCISLEEQKFCDFWCQLNPKSNWNNQTACAAVIASYSSAYMVPTSFPGLDVHWSRINLKKYVCVLHVCSWQHYVLNRSLKECLQDKGKASSVQCMRWAASAC